ncbi:unnamed protein product [Brassica rapa subsp. trilocularis]
MSSIHRGNASSYRQRGRNISNETKTRYTLKDPTAHGRDYLVEPFNLAFNMNITYGIFKNKLDEFKKSYKMWKFLMKSTGISVDPETSMI